MKNLLNRLNLRFDRQEISGSLGNSETFLPPSMAIGLLVGVIAAIILRRLSRSTKSDGSNLGEKIDSIERVPAK